MSVVTTSQRIKRPRFITDVVFVDGFVYYQKLFQLNYTSTRRIAYKRAGIKLKWWEVGVELKDNFIYVVASFNPH